MSSTTQASICYSPGPEPPRWAYAGLSTPNAPKTELCIWAAWLEGALVSPVTGSGCPRADAGASIGVAGRRPKTLELSCARGSHNLTALQALQNLVTVNAAFSELDDVNWLVEQLPRLRHLGVRGDKLGRHDRWHLELRSASLESIDLSMAGKGLAIGSLDCPKLRKVICGLYAYRNGLVLMTPSSVLVLAAHRLR